MDQAQDHATKRDGLLSLVVCTYNRAESLRNLLTCIYSLTPPRRSLELVVVDDASTDATPDVLREWQGKCPNLRALRHDAGPSLGAAEALALQSARGDLLVFTDDDCLPHQDWLLRMEEAIDRHGFVCGSVDTPRRPFLRWCHHIAEFHRFMPSHPPSAVLFSVGANMGLTRELLDAIGEYPQRQLGSDTALALEARRRGISIHFHPEAVVTHLPQRHRLRGLLRYSADHAADTIQLRQDYAAELGTPFILKRGWLVLAAAPVIAGWTTLKIYARHPALLMDPLTIPIVFLQKLAWCRGAAQGLKARRIRFGNVRPCLEQR